MCLVVSFVLIKRISFAEGWPPCVRVTVVRSSVMQPGTLFILTADAVATIGRSVTHWTVSVPV